MSPLSSQKLRPWKQTDVCAFGVLSVVRGKSIQFDWAVYLLGFEWWSASSNRITCSSFRATHTLIRHLPTCNWSIPSNIHKVIVNCGKPISEKTWRVSVAVCEIVKLTRAMNTRNCMAYRGWTIICKSHRISIWIPELSEHSTATMTSPDNGKEEKESKTEWMKFLNESAWMRLAKTNK